LVSVTVCAALLVPTGPLANVRRAGETVTDEESVPPGLAVWRLLVEGVNLIWADADDTRTRRESKTTGPPKKRLVPYPAGLELELWK
jgi:hypothetical protein